MAGYRTQWTGFDGHPQTINATAHTSLVNNTVGLGIVFINNKIGNMTNTETNLMFAYKLNLDKPTFSFGMQGGFQNYRTDYSAINVFDQGGFAFTGGERGTRINMGAGAVLKSENFFLRLSVPRLLPSTFENGGKQFELTTSTIIYLGHTCLFK